MAVRMVSIEELLGARSGDASWVHQKDGTWCARAEYGGRCDPCHDERDVSGDWLPVRRETMLEVLCSKAYDSGFDALAESIRVHGLAPGFEPTYFDGAIREGHHRLTVLWLMGLKEIPVRDTYEWGTFTAPDGSTPARCAH